MPRIPHPKPGACRSTTTLTPSTVGNTEELPLFLEGLHASPPVAPGSKAARAMTAGSGRRLFAFCSSQKRTAFVYENPLGILDLAEYGESPPVGSDGFALGDHGDIFTRTGSGKLLEIVGQIEAGGYEVQPIAIPACAVNSPQLRMRIWIVGFRSDRGRRIIGSTWPTPTTDADRNRTKKYAQGGTPLNMLVNQWPTPNARDTKSEESVPEYRRGARRRDARANAQLGGSRDVASPTATDLTRGASPETDADKKARGAHVGTSLTDAVAKANWPTPNTGDSERSGKRPSRGTRTGGYISEVVPATWPTPQVHQGPNNSENRGSAHGGRRRRLTPQNPEDLMANWPTPRNNTGEDVKRPQREKGGHHLTVGGAIRSWPTPNASDGSGGASDPSTRTGADGSMKHSTQLPDYIGSPTNGPLARMTKFVERLSNLSMWLMGYTAQYLRHWETRSSRSSCSDSSSLSEA
jgi:site-specific DNA-cytosine methylase